MLSANHFVKNIFDLVLVIEKDGALLIDFKRIKV
jgi:hypothetical protein